MKYANFMMLKALTERENNLFIFKVPSSSLASVSVLMISDYLTAENYAR